MYLKSDTIKATFGEDGGEKILHFIRNYIRRCVMVSLPLHGEIYAFYGDNMVAFSKNFVIIDIRMGLTYTCMGIKYSCIATSRYVCLFEATWKAC
jgi:hypothetical protein